MPFGKAEVIVNEANTASCIGSGFLPVFATPALVALMEQAACKALEGLLDEGSTTVGVSIEVEHLAATPIGMRIEANAVLKQTDGRFYIFNIEASDAKGIVGKAVHKRAVVQIEKFMQKAQKRGE